MRWIFLILFLLSLEFYAFQAIKKLSKSWTIRIGFVLLTLIPFFLMLYSFNQPVTGGTFGGNRGFFIGLFLSVFALKATSIIILFFEDLTRFLKFFWHKINTSKQSKAYSNSRRKFVSQLALGLGAIPFISLLYGMYKGKYNFKVLTYELSFEDLPEAFDGYQITQISDIHSGSFDNKQKIEYAVNLINEQASDCILFTGDLVNNLAEEMQPWLDTFSKLKSKDGVYSILGNHDYGDYHDWETEAEKQKNFSDFVNTHKAMGWQLLRNEHIKISRNQQNLHLIGVENWGKGGFKKAGDIDKACESLSPKDFKVVMSHDPSYWDEVLHKHPKNLQLTLSGHTHGMQFGIEIPGWFKWSPVQYRYKQWAGIYKHENRFINVNRGFGFLAYPGRVGIWPEISVIKLKKA